MNFRTGGLCYDPYHGNRPDITINVFPGAPAVRRPGPDDKQAMLNQSAEALAKGMKESYGEATYKDRSWDRFTLKEIAETGGFYSRRHDKRIEVSPETQQAARFIVENGGATLFDREGNAKDGIFTYDDLQHYTSQHPTKNSLGRGGIFRDEGAMVHIGRPTSDHGHDPYHHHGHHHGQGVQPINHQWRPSHSGNNWINTPEQRDAHTKYSVNVLVNTMKDVYGDEYKTRSWDEQMLKDIAEKGSFYSKKFNQEIQVSQEAQQAAKFIMENGGIAAFDKNNSGAISGEEFEQTLFNGGNNSTSSAGYI